MRLDGNQVVFVLRVEHKHQHEKGTNTGNIVVQEDELGGTPNTYTKSPTLTTSLSELHNDWHFHLHDLRSGTNFSFASWQELQDYIKEQSKKGLR